MGDLREPLLCGVHCCDPRHCRLIGECCSKSSFDAQLSSVHTKAPAATHNAVVDLDVEWLYDWTHFQPGRKCLLLTDSGIAVIGQTNEFHGGYKAWRPLPKEKKS